MAWTTANNILDGVNNVGILLDSVNTTLNGVDALLRDATNGLAAIKSAIGTLPDTSADVASIKNAIESTTYGLNKIKTLLAG